jgi:hypothetical protein
MKIRNNISTIFLLSNLIGCGETSSIPSDPPKTNLVCAVCPTLTIPVIGGTCAEGSKCSYISKCGGIDTYLCAGSWTKFEDGCASKLVLDSSVLEDSNLEDSNTEDSNTATEDSNADELD